MKKYYLLDKISILICITSLLLLFVQNNGITLGEYISKNYYNYICLSLFIISFYLGKFKYTIYSKISTFISKFMIYLYAMIFVIGIAINIFKFIKN